MDHETRLPPKTRTLVAQGPNMPEPVTHGLVPPIHMSTTFTRDPDNGYSGGRVYGGTDNPSVQQAETLIASLEGAEEALIFGSGMAAAVAVFEALERPVHIVASHAMYYGLRAWLAEIGQGGAYSVTFVDTSDLDAVRQCRAVREDRPGLDRDAEQPALDHHRHRRRCRDRTCDRRHAVCRFDGFDTDLHPPAIARRGHRGALGNKIPERAFRRRGGCAGDVRRQSNVATYSPSTGTDWRDSRPLRSLAPGARDADASRQGNGTGKDRGDHSPAASSDIRP